MNVDGNLEPHSHGNESLDARVDEPDVLEIISIHAGERDRTVGFEHIVVLKKDVTLGSGSRLVAELRGRRSRDEHAIAHGDACGVAFHAALTAGLDRDAVVDAAEETSVNEHIAR